MKSTKPIQNLNSKPLELRITTGLAKNKKLKAPEIAGFRAVQEVAKMAVFSMIGENIVGADVLDLFAGSGNMGIEALSRGANWCDFVDDNHDSTDIINENLTSLGFALQAEVFFRDAAKYAKSTEKTYDYIFMDPFYNDTHFKFLFKLLETRLKPTGRLMFFHSKNLKITDLIEATTFKALDERRFGISTVSMLSL